MKKLLGLLIICAMFASCETQQTITPTTNQTALPIEIINIIKDSSIVLDTKLVTSGSTIYNLQKSKNGEVFVASTMNASNNMTSVFILGVILGCFMLAAIIAVLD